MTLNEIRQRTSWRVIAGTTAVGAIGIGGLALVSSGDRAGALPDPVLLRDATPIASVTVAGTGFEVPAPFQPANESTHDSPDMAPTSAPAAASPSNDSPAAVASVDSPSYDSPAAVASVDSPSYDSPASVASVDSPASIDSPDSPDSSA